MEHLDCGEGILNSPYGHVWCNLYFMAHCLWSRLCFKCNVMAHAQKPDFVFWRNGQVHLNRWAASDQSTAGSQGVCISGSNAVYTMFGHSVKSTGYPLHLPFSPSLPLLALSCAITFQLHSTTSTLLQVWFKSCYILTMWEGTWYWGR